MFAGRVHQHACRTATKAESKSAPSFTRTAKITGVNAEGPTGIRYRQNFRPGKKPESVAEPVTGSSQRAKGGLAWRGEMFGKAVGGAEQQP